jgi:hypothetical protein
MKKVKKSFIWKSGKRDRGKRSMDKEVEIVDEEREKEKGRERVEEGGRDWEREDWVSKYLPLLWIGTLSFSNLFFESYFFFIVSISIRTKNVPTHLTRYYACNSRLFVLPTKNSNLHNYTLHFNSMLLFLIEKSES